VQLGIESIDKIGRLILGFLRHTPIRQLGVAEEGCDDSESAGGCVDQLCWFFFRGASCATPEALGARRRKKGHGARMGQGLGRRH